MLKKCCYVSIVIIMLAYKSVALGMVKAKAHWDCYSLSIHFNIIIFYYFLFIAIIKWWDRPQSDDDMLTTCHGCSVPHI
jgi:hypothetical protein